MNPSETQYFAEVEQHFRRVARKSPRWIMPPRCWQTVDSWREAGVPLEAVLRAIDICCERNQPSTLAYCERVVMDMCHRMPAADPATPQAIEMPLRLTSGACPCGVTALLNPSGLCNTCELRAER